MAFSGYDRPENEPKPYRVPTDEELQSIPYPRRFLRNLIGLSRRALQDGKSTLSAADLAGGERGGNQVSARTMAALALVTSPALACAKRLAADRLRQPGRCRLVQQGVAL